MNRHPWIDYSEAPLYRQIFPAEGTWDDVVAFRTAVNDVVCSATDPFAWVIDLGRGLGATADARARRYFADEDERLAPLNRALCAGVAFYVPKATTRGLITAVYWMAPPVFPYSFFSKLEEARAWAKGQLRSRGVSVP